MIPKWLIVLPWTVIVSTKPHDCHKFPAGEPFYEIKCSTAPIHMLSYNNVAILTTESEKEDPFLDAAEALNAAHERRATRKRYSHTVIGSSETICSNCSGAKP